MAEIENSDVVGGETVVKSQLKQTTKAKTKVTKKKKVKILNETRFISDTLSEQNSIPNGEIEMANKSNGSFLTPSDTEANNISAEKDDNSDDDSVKTYEIDLNEGYLHDFSLIRRKEPLENETEELNPFLKNLLAKSKLWSKVFP